MTHYIFPFFSLVLVYFVLKYMWVPSVRKIRRRYYFKKYGLISKGVVVDYSVSEEADGLVYYHSLIEYYNEDGKKFRIEDPIGKPSKGVIGKNVMVYYDKYNPGDFQLKGNDFTIIFAIVLSTLAIGVCIGYFLFNIFQF